MKEDGAFRAFDRNQLFDAKRMAVIVAAARAFHEFGYAETSLDEVARRLSVTKKTLYYYIKSKNEILVELFKLWLDTQEAAIDHSDRQEGGAVAKLVAYSKQYVSSVLKLDAPIDRVANEIASLSEKDRKLIDRRRSANDNRLRKIFQQGILDGEIRPDLNVKIAHYTLHGAIDWFFKYYQPAGELTPDEIVEEFTTILFQGMAACPRSK